MKPFPPTRFSLAALGLFALVTRAPAADWPQWRGPHRSNVSAETGLLKEWPRDGPPLAWKGGGLGDGVSPVAVAGGRVFSTGYQGDAEYCTALSAKDGKLLWKYDGMGTRIAATHAPVVRGDTVFYASGYGAGHALLKITRKGDGWAVEEVYRLRNNAYVPWLGSPTQVGGHIFLNSARGLLCVERGTGKTAWEERLGRCV